MRHEKEIKIEECVSQCERLGPGGAFGIVTPVSKKQYIGINTMLGLQSDIPIWFGLLANEDVVWNRYTKEQTVHSLAPTSPAHFRRKRDNVIFRYVPQKGFEKPVFYHNNFFVVDGKRWRARCVCKKGESPMQYRFEH